MTIKELKRFIRQAHIKPDSIIVVTDERGNDVEAQCVENASDCIINERIIPALRITKNG